MDGFPNQALTAPQTSRSMHDSRWEFVCNTLKERLVLRVTKNNGNISESLSLSLCNLLEHRLK